MSKTKNQVEQVVRSYARCPLCGYERANVNETEGKLHCHHCHRTSIWPLEIPAEVRLTNVLRDLFDDYQGDGSSLPDGKTSFGVPYDGEEFTVTIAKAA